MALALALPSAAGGLLASQGLIGAAAIAGSLLKGHLTAALQARSCTTRPLGGGSPLDACTPPTSVRFRQQPSPAGVTRIGNVYPVLTQQQLDAMRSRRLTSNCDPAQLGASRFDAHQAKHIMLCSGASCRSACKGCGALGAANGQRCWEYLSQRIDDVNQLRSEQDDEEQILCSRIDCMQLQNLLPPLAATQPCHGPIAVVYPEAVFYDRLSPLVLERIIEEHLLGGHTVTSHVMMGSRTPAIEGSNVLPALAITRRATPSGSFAAHYAW